MQGFNEAENHQIIKSKLLKAKLIDADGDSLPGCEEKIKEFFEAPYGEWLQSYEQGLKLSGLMDAEREFTQKIDAYCSSNDLIGHGSLKKNYRKELLLGAIEARTR